MKLITLNIWGGHVHRPLIEFFNQHRDVDVFCLQEVYHQAKETISAEDRWHHLDIFAEIAEALPEHQGYFCPIVNGIYGLAAFVKKSVNVIDEGSVPIHDNPDYPGRGPTHPRILQWLKLTAQEKQYVICNIHGLWNGQGKGDSPARLLQSERICDFTSSIDVPTLLCGDFNLLPDTESIRRLEVGMTNLITQHDITSTRTELYDKPIGYADYVLTPPDINVNHFEVLADVVSDHAPLLIEFNQKGS